MKRIFALLLIVVLTLSLTSCKKGDYKEATELFDTGKYEEAVTLFEKLGDYEDSSLMLVKSKYGWAKDLMAKGDYSAAEEMLVELGENEKSKELGNSVPWATFCAYIAEKNGVEIKNSEFDYTVKLTADKDNIVASYNQTTAMNEAIVTVVLSEKADSNELTGYGKMQILWSNMTDNASTIWDTNNYKTGDTVTWTEYDCSGKKADGSPLDPGATGLLYTTTDTLLERLTGGIKEAIDQSGLNVTMADIGFANY